MKTKDYWYYEEYVKGMGWVSAYALSGFTEKEATERMKKRAKYPGIRVRLVHCIEERF